MGRNQIICFEGDMGKGKTLLQTIFLLKTALYCHTTKATFNLFSNYKLNMDFKYVNIEYLDQRMLREFFKAGGGAYVLTDYIIAIDEIVTFADSYQWANKGINNFCKYALQSRKRNAKIFYTAQFISQAPVRLRKITNIIIRPTIDEQHDILNYDVYSFDGATKRFIRSQTINEVSKYFKFYDTDEIIEIID